MPDDIYAKFESADRRLFVTPPATMFNTFVPSGREVVDLGTELATAVSGEVGVLIGSVSAQVSGILSSIGQPNGIAPLGPDGKIPTGLLPVSGSPKGAYNAATNTPPITSGSGSPGDFYIVSTAGTVAADGVGAVNPGDQILRGQTAWGVIRAYLPIATDPQAIAASSKTTVLSPYGMALQTDNRVITLADALGNQTGSGTLGALIQGRRLEVAPTLVITPAMCPVVTNQTDQRTVLGFLQAIFDAYLQLYPTARKTIRFPNVRLNWPGLVCIGGASDPHAGTYSVNGLDIVCEGTQFICNNYPNPATGVIDTAWITGHMGCGWLQLMDASDVNFLGHATVDCDDAYLPYTMGYIIAQTGTTFDLQVLPGFRDDLRVAAGHFHRSNGIFLADYGTSGLFSGGVYPTAQLVGTNPSVLRIQKSPNAPSGMYVTTNGTSDLYVIQATKDSGVGCFGGWGARDVRWSNAEGGYKIYASGNLGAYTQGFAGEQDWTGFKVMIKPNSKRFISTNSDCMDHLNMQAADFYLGPGHRLQGSTDDCLDNNVDALVVNTVSGATVYGGAGGYGPSKYMKVGHQVQFFDTHGQIQGFAYISSIDSTSNPWSVSFAYNGFTNPLPSGITTGWKVCDITLGPASTKIVGGHIGDNWGNGYVPSCRNVTIEGNLIENVLFRGLIMTTGAGYNSGPLPSYFRIRNNDFNNCCRFTLPNPPAVEDMYAMLLIYNFDNQTFALSSWRDIYNVLIHSNHFRNSLAGGMFVWGVNAVAIKDNTTENICLNALGKTNPASDPRLSHISIGNVGFLTLNGNSRLDGVGTIQAIGGSITGMQSGLGGNPSMTVTGFSA